MNFFTNVSKWLNGSSKEPQAEEITFKDYNAEEEAVAEEPVPEAQSSTLTTGDSSIKFKIMKPSTFEEVAEIADCIIEGRTVSLDTEDLDMPTLRRMLDFLNGVTYTTDGEIQPAATNTYLITPHNVDLT